MDSALLISTGIGCGVLCSYCPQGTIGKAYMARSRDSRMSFDTFKTCVDKLTPDVALHFNGFYEPFLNRECTEMMLYAVKRGFPIRVSTTLMGLELGDIERFKQLPFTKFAVHLPDNKGLTKIKVDDRYLAVLARLIESDISQIGYHVHEGATGPEDVQIHARQLLERKGIVPENRWVLTRAGNIKIDGVLSRERLKGELEMCPRIRDSVLLPNGDVALCCMDWSLKHVIGNLMESDYRSLFKSNEYKRVLRGYSDDSEDILCRYCEIAQTKKDALLKPAMKAWKALKSARAETQEQG